MNQGKQTGVMKVVSLHKIAEKHGSVWLVVLGLAAL